jgi:predicted secreted hydrolase
MRKPFKKLHRAVFSLTSCSLSSMTSLLSRSISNLLLSCLPSFLPRLMLSSQARLIPRLLANCLIVVLSIFLIPAQVKAEPPRFAQVDPRTTLSFPRDFGAHPDFRTEWWYATGWLQTADGKQLGFQVTFFRSATEHERSNPSKFAPKQLIVAHAALSDPAIGKLQHDQRVARAGFGLAQTSETTTDIKLGTWSMLREADGRYRVALPARDFSFDLTLAPTQPILLQGSNGYSRKGPKPEQASHYYSEPHLQVSGAITLNGKTIKVTGSAWLDHEWSSTVLDPKAVGWDWIGANLDDGRALMAFRIRGADGSSLWQHASLREKDGRLRQINGDAIRFTPVRFWRSPRTQARYPVEVTLEIDQQRWQLRPLQDDQELDSRQSTGAVYWEGAVTLERDGRREGRGYLEMTGYVKPLKL